jgi:membrane-bound metal-dependent hydrolase YbcI (DUF457 family)
MALPLAHAAAGYALHRLDRRETTFAGWRRAAVYIVLANLPDADFILGFLLGKPGVFHRGVSHTVLASVIVGALGAWMARRWYGDRFGGAWLAFSAVYGSHLLVDGLTIDERGPAGAQFLWPFTEAYYIAPVTVFHEIFIDGTTRLGFLTTVFAPENLPVLLREGCVAGLSLTVLLLILRRRRNAEAGV